MENKSNPTFWWVKTPQNPDSTNITVPKLDLDISSSLAEFLEKEQAVLQSRDDVGSIIDEITRVAAQSPLGPYDKSFEDRSLDDIMKETERLYMESSKSFEQLSQRSKTSQNVTELQSNCTPTPKSVSPLPLDKEGSEYSDDFSTSIESEDANRYHSPTGDIEEPKLVAMEAIKDDNAESECKIGAAVIDVNASGDCGLAPKQTDKMEEDLEIKENIIKTLEQDNRRLREDFRILKSEFQQTSKLLEQTKASLSAKSLCSPELNLELDRTLEQLKDTKEINTALQLQLDNINKTHYLLKNSYEDLLNSHKITERKMNELEEIVMKYKMDLVIIEKENTKLKENELNLGKLLEMDKLQIKNCKIQSEKDAKCILDLNRQIKEMERIITRKHPDSVSALIVAAKSDVTDQNLTARKLLEDRIRILEDEASKRDMQSSKVFLDIQEKFNQMKLKYESHIEDLELHVNDLKEQLKRKCDSYDVYTQTNGIFHEKNVMKTIGLQTDELKQQQQQKINVKHDNKNDSHLLATLRGLQNDLTNKEKVVMKLQKELDELRKTNKRLQKEREGNLKSLTDKKELRNLSEKFTNPTNGLEGEIKQLRLEKDKIKQQLFRIEEDYQALKAKRLHDLNALQEAHEHEIATYVNNITPLREQLELQQITITTLQQQLSSVKEKLSVVRVERDNFSKMAQTSVRTDSSEIDLLREKVTSLEKRYEDRELRLKGVVQNLAQKSVLNRSCEQCIERQRQLVKYRVELDQILASVRALK